jgi:methyltransferase-like protein
MKEKEEEITKAADEINIRRQKSKDKANDEYNNLHSPHYRDNERFGWAIDAINKSCDEEISNLKISQIFDL